MTTDEKDKKIKDLEIKILSLNREILDLRKEKTFAWAQYHKKTDRQEKLHGATKEESENEFR
jgi:hypothetical protein